MIVLSEIFILFGFALCCRFTDAAIPRERTVSDVNQTVSDGEIDHNGKQPTTETSILQSYTQKQNVRQTLTHFLPTTWQQFCEATFKFVSGSNFTAHWAVFVSCDLDQSHYWSLQEYRDWITANEDRIYKYLQITDDLKFAFEFKCRTKLAKVSLPWPLRAKYLWYVSADNCTLLDHLLEFDMVHNTTNSLRVVVHTDCDMETDPDQLFRSMQHFSSVSRDFDCGGELTEKLVQQNVQKTFPMKEQEKSVVPQTMPKNFDKSTLDKMILSSLNQSMPTSPIKSDIPIPVGLSSAFKDIAKPDLKSAFKDIAKSDLNSAFKDITKPDLNSAFKDIAKPDLNSAFKDIAKPDGTSGLAISLKSDLRSTGTSPNLSESTREPQSEQDMINSIARIGQQYQQVGHQCVYRNLRYLDQSQLRYRAKHHIHFLLEKSSYPVLEYFNLSHSRLEQMSSQMLQWRRYFPKMKYLDLSHNKIKYLSTLSDNGLTGEDVGVLDLRHNNITTLTSDDLNTMSLHSRTMFIDIRDNPLSCDCKLTQFVTELKNTSRNVFNTYKYLKNMTCASPAQHKGTVVSTLENDFCTALEVLVLVVPVILLCCFIVLIIIIFILVVKFRKEILILAFTRLHISLPCRKVEKSTEKAYDAFIAYSEHDGPWVFDTLLPRLEQPITNNGPGFKLCIHHRDFPLGRCIVDNIIDKVQESRHTVLILSNQFLKSQWCKYEFKTAFTQSITEKKQHLIMVIKEDLHKHLIDNDLKQCLKTFTYVKTDDRLFWDKIVFALADGDMNRISRQNFKNVETIKTQRHSMKGHINQIVIVDETKHMGMNKVMYEDSGDNKVTVEIQDQNKNHVEIWNTESDGNKHLVITDPDIYQPKHLVSTNQDIYQPNHIKFPNNMELQKDGIWQI